jgi:hypothetical protein
MYLESRGALGPVLAWRPASDACSGCKGLATAATAHDLVLALGLHYRPWDRDDRADSRTSVWAPVPSALDAKGFDVVFPALNCWGADRCQGTDDDAKDRWRARLDGVSLVVTHGADETVQIPLSRLEHHTTAQDDDEGSPRSGPIVEEGSFKSARYRLHVRSVVFERDGDGGPLKVTSLDGVLLLGLAR